MLPEKLPRERRRCGHFAARDETDMSAADAEQTTTPLPYGKVALIGAIMFGVRASWLPCVDQS